MGFPDAIGAVDGSIFKVERPFDYEGSECVIQRTMKFLSDAFFQMDL